MAGKRKRRELIPVWRSTACGKEMTDGAAVNWLYFPEVTGRMLRVGVAEDEDDDRDYESEDHDE